MEVAENGDIANWKIPGKMVKVWEAQWICSLCRVYRAMMHVNKAGESKILKNVVY
jgi:acyl CoA:acetate/3-ketoacid CoA transferase beta subunit